MKLQQIFMQNPNPNNEYADYENQFKPRIDFDTPHAKEIFQNHQNKIMEIVETEITNYIHDDDLCNDSENMFPKRSLLTGEWYISSIHFGNGILSMEIALIGLSLGYKDDYLGLDIYMKYDEGTKQFTVYGVDSSSI